MRSSSFPIYCEHLFRNNLTISDEFVLGAEDNAMYDEDDEDGKEYHILACHLTLNKVNK